jgi:Pseudouridine synthase
MIVALGQATKYTQYFNVLPKTYEAKGILGIKTDTKDISGNVIQKIENVNITCEELKSTIEKFKGKITQIPPIYSAKKINGKKLTNWQEKSSPKHRAETYNGKHL